jgi:hypothetical protein
LFKGRATDFPQAPWNSSFEVRGYSKPKEKDLDLWTGSVSYEPSGIPVECRACKTIIIPPIERATQDLDIPFHCPLARCGVLNFPLAPKCYYVVRCGTRIGVFHSW